MLEFIFTNFVSIDFYGRNLMFEDNNSQQFKTPLGALVTLFTLAITALLSFFTSKDFFLSTPSIKEFNQLVESTSVDLVDFPLIFSFFNEMNEELIPIKDLEELNNMVEVRYDYLTLTTSGREIRNPNFLNNINSINSTGLQACSNYNYNSNNSNNNNKSSSLSTDNISNLSKNPNLNKLVKKTLNENEQDKVTSYCFNSKTSIVDLVLYNNKLLGLADLTDLTGLTDLTEVKESDNTDKLSSSSLIITIRKCSKNNPKCKFNLNFKLLMYYFNSFFNIKTNSEVYYKDYISKDLDTRKNLKKELIPLITFTLINDEIQIDNGLLDRKITKKSTLKVDSIEESYYRARTKTNINEENDENDDEDLLKLKFQVTNKKTITVVSYVKLPEVFFTVGGILYLITMTASLLLRHYTWFKCRLNYSNQITQMYLKNSACDFNFNINNSKIFEKIVENKIDKINISSVKGEVSSPINIGTFSINNYQIVDENIRQRNKEHIDIEDLKLDNNSMSVKSIKSIKSIRQVKPNKLNKINFNSIGKVTTKIFQTLNSKTRSLGDANNNEANEHKENISNYNNTSNNNISNLPIIKITYIDEDNEMNDNEANEGNEDNRNKQIRKNNFLSTAYQRTNSYSNNTNNTNNTNIKMLSSNNNNFKKFHSNENFSRNNLVKIENYTKNNDKKDKKEKKQPSSSCNSKGSKNSNNIKNGNILNRSNSKNSNSNSKTSNNNNNKFRKEQASYSNDSLWKVIQNKNNEEKISLNELNYFSYIVNTFCSCFFAKSQTKMILKYFNSSFLSGYYTFSNYLLFSSRLQDIESQLKINLKTKV